MCILTVYLSFLPGTTGDTSISTLALLLKGIDWKSSRLPIQNIIKISRPKIKLHVKKFNGF